MIAHPFYVRILVALAVAQPFRAGAQEIHGVVASEGTGAGLSGAGISALSLDGTVLATPVFPSASSGGGGPAFGAAGLHARFGSSGNTSLVSPRGFGAGAAVRLTERIDIRVDAGRYDGRVDRTGRTCRQTQPVDRFCTDEVIMGSTSLTSLEVAAALSLDVGGPVGVGLGIGPVVGVISSEARGASGRLADVALPKTAHVGFAGLAELRVIPDALPLFLTAGLRLQRLHPDGCLGDPPLTEQPFCGPLSLRWGQLEIGWRW